MVDADAGATWEAMAIPCDNGNATIFLSRHAGDALVVDCAPLGRDARKTLLDELRSAGIKRIRGIVVTHPHRDHMGGVGDLIADAIAAEFEVGHLYAAGSSFCALVAMRKGFATRHSGVYGTPWRNVDKSIRSLRRRLGELGRSSDFVPLHSVREGQFGTWIHIEPHFPVDGEVAKLEDRLSNPNEAVDPNELSLICSVVLYGASPAGTKRRAVVSFMVAGDAPRTRIEEVTDSLDEVPDVYIVPHHGSKTSHSPKVVRRIAKDAQVRVRRKHYLERFEAAECDDPARLEEARALAVLSCRTDDTGRAPPSAEVVYSLSLCMCVISTSPMKGCAQQGQAASMLRVTGGDGGLRTSGGFVHQWTLD